MHNNWTCNNSSITTKILNHDFGYIISIHRKKINFLLVSWSTWWGITLLTTGFGCMDLAWLSTEHDIHRLYITTRRLIIIKFKPTFPITILVPQFQCTEKLFNFLLMSWFTCWGMILLTTGFGCMDLAWLIIEHGIHRLWFQTDM